MPVVSWEQLTVGSAPLGTPGHRSAYFYNVGWINSVLHVIYDFMSSILASNIKT